MILVVITIWAHHPKLDPQPKIDLLPGHLEAAYKIVAKTISNLNQITIMIKMLGQGQIYPNMHNM